MAEPKQDVKLESKEAAKDSKSAKRAVTAKKRADGVSRYFRETKAELKKIVWPTPKQVLNNTIVVIISILVVGAFIWLLDALTSNGLNALLDAFVNK